MALGGRDDGKRPRKGRKEGRTMGLKEARWQDEAAESARERVQDLADEARLRQALRYYRFGPAGGLVEL
jgi:hypothetical protein